MINDDRRVVAGQPERGQRAAHAPRHDQLWVEVARDPAQLGGVGAERERPSGSRPHAGSDPQLPLGHREDGQSLHLGALGQRPGRADQDVGTVDRGRAVEQDALGTSQEAGIAGEQDSGHLGRPREGSPARAASARSGRWIMAPDVNIPRRLEVVGNQTQSLSASRVALVHDFLLDVRGAERVFLELCAMWPEADIFTAVYDEHGTEGRFAGRNVHSSFLQGLRPSARTFRALLPLYPAAIESFDFSGYDLVVSSSSAWAHAVICDERSVHVSYCHNPFRYAWNDRDQTLARRRNPVTRAFLRGAFRRWRQWDWIAAQRTNRYVANSMITQARIRAYFGRESTVVYPPVDTKRFSPGPVGDHYVMVSELMAHKQIDVAIAAFNQLRLPLVIIGDGPHARRLQRLAGPTVTLAGRLSDDDVASTLSQRAGVDRDLGRGVRHRRRREPGCGAPRHRSGRRRRTGDDRGRGHRLLLVRWRRSPRSGGARVRRARCRARGTRGPR